VTNFIGLTKCCSVYYIHVTVARQTVEDPAMHTLPNARYCAGSPSKFRKRLIQKKIVSTKEYKCPAKIFSSKNISYYAQLNYLTPKTQESNEVDKA
jgi:hypothetical protein